MLNNRNIKYFEQFSQALSPAIKICRVGYTKCIFWEILHIPIFHVLNYSSMLSRNVFTNPACIIYSSSSKTNYHENTWIIDTITISSRLIKTSENTILIIQITILLPSTSLDKKSEVITIRHLYAIILY